MSRERLLQELCEVIRIKFPSAAVNAFGSYAADLSIFLSDLDVSIIFPSSDDRSVQSLQRLQFGLETVSDNSGDEPPPFSDLQQRKEEGNIIPLDKPVNQHLYLSVWEEEKPGSNDRGLIIY